MAIRKSPTLVGRGNEDSPIEVDITAASGSFVISVEAGVTRTSFSPSNNFLGTVGIPDGSLSFNITTEANPTEDIAIQITGTPTQVQIVAAIGTAFASNAAFTTSISTNDITVSQVNTGRVVSPVITATGTSVPCSFSDIDNGRTAFKDEATQYIFSGPFTDVVPVGDPLHGMATMARIFSDFFKDYIALDITGVQSPVETRFRNLYNGFRTSLADTFPQSFSNSGVVRGVTENRKIAIKGSRRDSKQQVGRGRKSISDTFVNDTADYGLRQLILRIYDEVFDIFTNLNNASTFANGKTLVENSLVEFNLEFGELESFAGVSASNPSVKPVLYENTIVEGSGDQGLLIYSDELIKVINDTTFPGVDGDVGNWSTWKASLATNVGNTQKLKLKN